MYIRMNKSIVLAVLTTITCLVIPQAYADKISDERLEKQKRFLEMRERERAEKKQLKEREKQNKQIRKKNCETAKKRHKEYKYARGVYELDKNGNRVYADKAKRKEIEKQTAAAVKKWCK